MQKNSLVVVKHIIECVIELIRHLLDLELFAVDLILNIVNSVVELGDVHLSVFITSLSMLESVHKLVNFVLELLFTLLCFLSRDLKLLHVLTNSLQFLFNIPQFAFSQLSALIGPLKLIFLYSQFPSQLIEFLFIITGHLGGFPQVFVCLLNFNLIPHGLVFKVFDLLENTISILGSHGEFGDSFSKRRISFLCFLLHQHDTSGQCTDFLFCVLESFFFLLKGSQGLGEFVIGFIKVTLISLNLLSQITDVSLMLVIFGVGILGVSFVSGNGGQELIGLRFERLHLLSDGIHG